MKVEPTLTELLVTILSIAFAGWAGVVWKASQNLARKVDNIMKEFRFQSVDLEHRITKLETKVTHIDCDTSKILDLINRNSREVRHEKESTKESGKT